MSNMERNKGKLIPTNMTPAEYAEIAVTGKLPSYCDTKEEMLRSNEDDYAVVILKDMVYKVEFEVCKDTDGDFADVVCNADGTIDFHTYHYNGAGTWSELVEDEL
ncbi:MAG: hypothetical protein LC687_03640 [Actinobacteria bacterium]|nr:hypothetical protein [Actinomycetota bacterium]